MEIWLVVFLGPLILFAAAAAIVKGAQFLFSSDGVIRLISGRGFDAVALVVIGAAVLILIAGVVALWLVQPFAAIMVGIFLLIGATRVWSLWHQRWQDNFLYDGDNNRPLPPSRF